VTARPLLALGALAVIHTGCEAPTEPGDSIAIGLMLSYSGYLAANSINSERALHMALDSVNDGGGVGGKPLSVIARDTQSKNSKVIQPARDLLAAGVATIIGPDTVDLVTQLRPILGGHTIILPSYHTGSDVGFGSRPQDWFVMGVAASKVACELVTKMAADGRERPLLIANPNGYGSTLTWELMNKHALAKYVLPIDQSSTAENVQELVDINADAYLLAAFPTSASSLIYALSAIGKIGDPKRWYLSPTLHTKVFLQFIPRGAFDGARGVAPGTEPSAGGFRTLFAHLWQDEPLDEAYAFYDAGIVAALALERAVLKTGGIPTANGLSQHIIAVTASGGTPIQWNEYALGRQLLERGQEIEYLGLSGPMEFDQTGQTPEGLTKWWTIGPDGFSDVPERSVCK
jgi:ABC-type branched-subunit amino acid transport system substrate-binding protein